MAGGGHGNSGGDRASGSIVTYLNHISNKNKFKYLVIIILIVKAAVCHLDLRWTLWIGLIIGVMLVYYLNEQDEQDLSDETHQGGIS